MRIVQMGKHPLEHVSDAIKELQVQDGHFTFLQSTNDFQQKFSNIKNNLNQFVEIKEDDKGVKTPMVNINKDVDFISKDLVKKHNGKSLSAFSNDVFNELKTDTIKDTINPYAQAKIRRHLDNAQAQEYQSAINEQSKIKNTHDVASYNTLLEQSANNTNINTYKNDIANATHALSVSGIDANTKAKLIHKIPKVFSSFLVEKLSYENPMGLLKLYKENPNHDAFKYLEPHTKHRYLLHATQQIKTDHQVKLAGLSMDLPNKLKAVEYYGNVDEDFFKEYIATSNIIGNAKDANKITNAVVEAQMYYGFYHSGNSLDIEDFKKRYHKTFTNIDPKDPNLSILLKLKDRIGSEINQLENAKSNDPAKYIDQLSLMGVTDTKALEDVSMIDKRHIIGSIVGVSKVLTNNESNNEVSLLNQLNTKEELATYISSLGEKYETSNIKSIVNELSESSNANPFTKFIAKAYVNDNQSHIQHLFNLKEKHDSGALNDDMLPLKHVSIMKDEIYRGDNKDLKDVMQSLPADKARGLLDFIYLSAKDNYTRNNDKDKSIEQAIDNVLKENYYINKDANVLIPKQIYEANGARVLTDHESTMIGKNMELYKKNDNWTDLKIASLFPDFLDLSKYQAKEYKNQLLDAVDEGQFVLEENKGGYTFQFILNNRVFYDMDGNQKKIFSIKDILDKEYSKQDNDETLENSIDKFVDLEKIQSLYSPY